MLESQVKLMYGRNLVIHWLNAHMKAEQPRIVYDLLVVSSGPQMSFDRVVYGPTRVCESSLGPRN